MEPTTPLQPKESDATSPTPDRPRPKVLRRPSSLLRTEPLEEPLPSHTLPPTLGLDGPTAAFSTPSAWQNDRHFAITLLFVILFANIIIVYWLESIAPKAPATTTLTQPMGEVLESTPRIHVLGEGTATEDK